MIQWSTLSREYPGWSLDEVKEFSPRERLNWLELAREAKGIVRK